MTAKNYCGNFRRHVWVVANVSQVIQLGADEVYVCFRCRKPRRPTPNREDAHHE